MFTFTKFYCILNFAKFSGLKKVTNDMKTHKNPELRKHHVPVPYKPTPTTYKPMSKSSASQAPAKPPKLALEGKKWIIVSSCFVVTFANCAVSAAIFKAEASRVALNRK